MSSVLEALSIWYMLSGVLLLVFIYPYVIYPAILWLLPKQSYISDVPVDEPSRYSTAILFCAYNEAVSLPKKIENIREIKQKWPHLVVYAYSDGSTDATNKLLLEANDVLTPVIGEKRIGKVYGMQKLVSMADAEIIIFTDANVILELEFVPKLLRYFNNPEIGAVAGTLHYARHTNKKVSPTASVGGMYWRLEEYIKKLESETGSTMGADGAIFARRKDGYPKIPDHLVDDMAASIAVLFDGKRCISVPDVCGYEYSVENSKEEFRRKRRIACGSYSTYRFFAPKMSELKWLDHFKFFSHKILRWYGGFFLLAAFACLIFGGVATNNILEVLALIGLVIGLFLVLVKIKLYLAESMYEFIRAITATGIGVMESLCGRTYSTWAPAKNR